VGEKGVERRGWEVGDREARRKRLWGRKISILNKKGGKFRKKVGGGRKGCGRWEKRRWEVGKSNPPVHLL
jgi:hypothetical protein